MIGRLTNPKKQLLLEDDYREIPAKCKEISAQVTKWRQSTTERIKQRDPRNEAYLSKRGRDYVVTEDPNQRNKRPEQPQPTAANNFMPVLQRETSGVNRSSMELQRSASDSARDLQIQRPLLASSTAPASMTVPPPKVDDFDKAIALINENTAASVFRVYVCEPAKYECTEFRAQNGHNMGKFINELSKLINVVTLEIEIG